MKVLTHGCFDVLHSRHIKLLKYSKSLGDELVVSLLSDEYVRMYKGASRPIHTLHMRIEHLLELRCVDRVVVVDGPGHEAVQKMIEEVRPEIYVKGGEYQGKLLEQEFLDALGVKVVFMDMTHDMDEKRHFSKLIKEFNE